MGKKITYFCDACHTTLFTTDTQELDGPVIKSAARPQQIGRAELCDSCYHAVRVLLMAKVVAVIPQAE